MQIRALCAYVGRLVLAVLVLGVYTFSASFVQAQPPGQTKTKAPPKTVQIAFVNAPWSEVIHWLTEETGKPYLLASPNGRFTFVGPPGKKYTIPEAIAIINEGLAQTPNDPHILTPHEGFLNIRLRKDLVGGK